MSYGHGEPSVRFPVALLTLRYREEGRERRLTLQATAEVVEALRDACDRVLTGAGR